MSSPQGPDRRGMTYYGGLDGLRALAIVAVLVYHGGVVWATGGFLGVEAFFVLSGFLITSLLVSEWSRHGAIALKAFWGRRARRLLPALFVLVTVVGLHQLLASADELVPSLRGDGIATLLYYGNWHQIATQSNYFAATGPISPLQHTWSLAIEEQFYILWPLLFVGTIWCGTRLSGRRVPDPQRSLRLLLLLAVAGTLASVVDSVLLFAGGRGLNRVYYGTDTRAMSILSGVTLALGVAVFRASSSRRPARRAEPMSAGPRRARRAGLAGLAGIAALAAVLAMMHVAEGGSRWLYPLGFVGVDLAVVVLISVVVFFPASLVGRLFSLRPLRAIGMISYGLYLWHFPLYIWLTASSTGTSGMTLLALRIAVTAAVAVVSYFLIEQPVRQRRLPAWLVRSLSPVAAAGAVAALLIGTAVASSPSVAQPPRPVPQQTGQTCVVPVKDTSHYGLVPLTAKSASVTQPKWLAARAPEWSGSGRLTFHVCPPKRVLLVGDSLAFSMGMAMMINEQDYGVELADAAILGCSFTTRGEINVSGDWQQQRPGCKTALQQWVRDESALRAQVAIVELGFRDESDWRWSGQVVHLGQPRFDAYLRQRIDAYVHRLARRNVKVLFLTIPWTLPRALPNGSPAPAGSAERHRLINSTLRSEVRRFPGKAALLDIDPIVAPGNHYSSRINGQLCRFDGVHFTIYCGQLLQPAVLKAAAAMAGR